MDRFRISQAGGLARPEKQIPMIALGHEEMQVGVKIHPGSEGLDGRDDSGHKLALGGTMVEGDRNG
jgi:hypothetical protein